MAIGILDSVNERGIIATRINIIPSRENKDIKKWCRWVRNVNVIAKNARCRNRIICWMCIIELREDPIYDLQDHCFRI